MKKVISLIVVFTFALNSVPHCCSGLPSVAGANPLPYAICNKPSLSYKAKSESILAKGYALRPAASLRIIEAKRMEFRPENTKTIKLADILEGKITLIMIKPEVNDDVAGNLKRDGTTFGRDDLIEEIARRAGLEVIMKFGPIDFSEEDMDVFYDEAKKGWAKKFADKGPGFPDKILMRTKQQFGGGPVYIAILKGDNEPWQRVRDVLGKTDGSEAESIRYDYGTVVIHHDDGTMTMFNRAHGSDSLTSVLFEIYFFAAIKAIPIINQESIQPLESTLLETGRIPTSLVVTNKLLGPSLKGQASGMNFGKNRAVLTAIASAA